MRCAKTLLLVAATGTAVALGDAKAQSAGQEEIAATVAKGIRSTEIEQAAGESVGPNARFYSFRATITGPLNRVHNAAAEAGRQRLPLPTDSVLAELSAPHVLVEVKAKPPIEHDGAMRLPPRLMNVAIRSRATGADKAQQITPDSVQVIPTEWITDGNGVKHSTMAIRAFFRPEGLPRADFDLLVATHRSEEVIPISRAAARKVR